MIMKKGSAPLKLLGLQALERRLVANHEQMDFIKEELRIVQAGMNGEKKLQMVFEKYSFPFEYYVFHDLQLISSGRFQIDTLFLSRYGAVILEMKNIRGQISFPEDRRQLVRCLDNGKTDAFECPSIQLERNIMLLEDWFHTRQYALTVNGASVFARPQQQFDNIRENMMILFPMEVPGYLRKFEKKTVQIDSSTLKSMATELMDGHQDYNPYPMCSTYKINPELIETGVCCKACGFIGMIRFSRGWLCERCGNHSHHAHLEALMDRYMLIGGPFTNLKCREFLHLEDVDVMKRLLLRMEIPWQGANKGREYRMTPEYVVKYFSR